MYRVSMFSHLSVPKVLFFFAIRPSRDPIMLLIPFSLIPVNMVERTQYVWPTFGTNIYFDY